MASWTRDIRLAARGLWRDPRFSLFVAMALALGIGANVATFGLAHRLLVSGPGHVVDGDRVRRVIATVERTDGSSSTTGSFGHVVGSLLRTASPVLAEVGTYTVHDALIDRGAASRRIRLGYADDALFPLLGVRPEVGRFFGPTENATRDAARVAVLSHGLWIQRFGGASDVLGQVVVFGDVGAGHDEHDGRDEKQPAQDAPLDELGAVLAGLQWRQAQARPCGPRWGPAEAGSSGSGSWRR